MSHTSEVYSAQQLKDQSAVATYNKVLRNTYSLLSLNLMVSAITAIAAVTLKVPPLGLIVTLGGYFALLFTTHKLKNSGWGIISVFALTGFMGFTLGPTLGMYWSMAPSVVMQALIATAITFFGLSAYALISKRDFSFLKSFLFVGILVAFIAGLAAYFLEIPTLSLSVSAMFVLLMSGLILYETSRIVKGGETNYITATVTLFVAIFNLFLSLLQLMGAFQSD